jgi:tetratricopeptide (TPR) repeat protein
LANFQNERELLAQLEGLFRQKKFEAGLTQADVVLGQYPASFQLKLLKYKFLCELQRNDEALFLLREMHAMFGDNIIILKELADMHFRRQQFPESLLYYKKLLFLDSFNTQAQERIKHLQGMLEASMAEKLADTRVEAPGPAVPPPAQAPGRYPKGTPAQAPGQSPKGTPAQAPGQSPNGTSPIEAGLPQITFESDAGGGQRPAAGPEPVPAEGLHFETESAAELYFKQGLYRESLAIYKNLFEKTGRTDFFLKIKAILLLLRTDHSNQVIERLQRFLLLIQERGKQVV